MLSQLKNMINSSYLKRLFTIAIAGILIVVTTACNGNPPAPKATGSGEYHSTKGQNKELYSPVQSKKSDAMYPYEDMDKEASRETKNKADNLVKNAKKNLSKVNGPEEFAQNLREGTPLNERVKNLSEDVGESAKQFQQDIASGTKHNVNQLKQNTKNAIEHPESIVENLQ